MPTGRFPALFGGLLQHHVGSDDNFIVMQAQDVVPHLYDRHRFVVRGNPAGLKPMTSAKSSAGSAFLRRWRPQQKSWL